MKKEEILAGHLLASVGGPALKKARGPNFRCLLHDVTYNSAVFLIIMLSGALGTLLRGVRSLYWYTGNRELRWSWAAMYFLLPFSGAMLATIFYLLVSSGFTQAPGKGGPYGLAAVGALVAMFSEEAILKLRQVAESLLTKPEKGKDTAAPPPRIAGLSLAAGPQAGGTPVVITGDNFNQGLKVNFDRVPAGVGTVTKTTISVTTPPHAAGKVDVEIVNPDGRNDVLKQAFTYS